MKILFLCTGNSCRSQIAEGWCRKLYGDKIQCYSAGTKKSHVNPNAIAVMNEVGVDISQHTSKTVDELPNVKFDFVFTLCGHAHEHCPIFQGANIIHVGFTDPFELTQGLSQDESMNVFRKTRDEILKFIKSLKTNYVKL